MKYGKETTQMVSVDRISLNLNNPRHEPALSEAEAIASLCKTEYIKELAKDMAKEGLNPLDLFALIPAPKAGTRETYIVAEGNRRFCALKLLNDPDLAPPQDRAKYSDMAATWSPIPRVHAKVFKNQDEVDLWVERIHGGVQGGIGRKPWNSEQKTRWSGSRRHLLAQKFLDYAQGRGFLPPDQRKGKITTASRFLSNVTFRETLGIDSSNLDDLCRIREQDDFDTAVKAFVDELVEGLSVHSRMNRPHILEYARDFPGRVGLSARKVPPVSISSDLKGKKSKKPKPKAPLKKKRLHYSQEIFDALAAIPSYKLEKIYYSLCQIELQSHTPLLSVGVWSFLDSLTALCGKKESVKFPAFLSKQKLQMLGCTERGELRTTGDAINSISNYGNTTKHDKVGAMFNGEQLANEFEVIAPIVLALALEAKKAKK